MSTTIAPNDSPMNVEKSSSSKDKTGYRVSLIPVGTQRKVETQCNTECWRECLSFLSDVYLCAYYISSPTSTLIQVMDV